MFGRFELLHQISAGDDGVRFRARDPESGELVEVFALNAAEAGSSRGAYRAKRLREALLLNHSSARRIRQIALDASPAYVVLDELQGRLLADPAAGSQTPRSWAEVAPAALFLLEGVSEAHRLGLVHGSLGPTTIRTGGSLDFKIDWSGLMGEPVPFPAPSTRERLEAATDVKALGKLFAWWLTAASWGDWRGGESLPDCPADVSRLITEMLAPDPVDRPTARALLDRFETQSVTLQQACVSQNLTGGFELTSDLALPAEDGGLPLGGDAPTFNRTQLGRFLLREKLGEGGMGAVFRAEDAADGSVVAIKILRGNWARRPEALRRFLKEARLLAEVNNPYVANLIELNEDEGIYYLAIEYVAGITLGQFLTKRGRLSERTSLSIMADVARGLATAHERGIIHRDIKPENILVVEEGDDGSTSHDVIPRVKLSDFGLARHVVESDSLNMTQAGAILGTPLYMAPEQCAAGDAIGPASDVYAMGATLFHLLTGRPPFVGPSPLSIISMHQNERPPEVREFNDAVSDGAGQIIAKALAKQPEWRYADAAAMLEDLDRLLRGEPTGIVAHPRIPEADPRKLSRFEVRLELDAPAWQLWPYVSNTERFNRAIGLPAVPFTLEYDSNGDVRRYGHLRKSGVSSSWREYPFEWIEGKRMGVFREFSEGPFQWFTSIVELTPKRGGGTTLVQSLQIASHSQLGRAVAAVEIGIRGRRSMEQVYRRIDAALTGKLGRDSIIDPFESAPELSKARRGLIERSVETLLTKGVDPLTAEQLGDFLERGSPQEVVRIRPLALARRWGVEPEHVIGACLHGAREGALVLLWDILCPVCRIPSQVIETLRDLREHGHCDVCRVDFDLDFANSVELIFRAHPEIRDVELGTFCIGGPAHSPHVVAQARLASGERLSLDLALAEGSYRIRGPQLAFVHNFRVTPEVSETRLEFSLTKGPDEQALKALRSGSQVIIVTNESDRELIVRVERTAARDDALTAARASAHPLFRALFPAEVLSPGQLINLATVTLVFTELENCWQVYEELGDSGAFALLHEHFQILGDCVRRFGGAVIKTINEGIVAVFSDSVSAVESALAMGPALAGVKGMERLGLKVGVHRGPALVATLNDHLDYFGTTVGVASRLPGLAAKGGIAVSSAVAAEPRVSEILKARGIAAPVVSARLPGLEESFIHLLEVPPLVRLPAGL